ncbi:putative endoribonuclease L-PSP [Enterococcus faecalis TX1467]|nr:putative endoribonuclease L-PSP [Enterococcus faecalis TX1467]
MQYNGKIETNKITKSNNLSFTGGKEMTTIKTKQAPQAIGPYSQAKIVNGLLITSGQIPLDPETGKVVGTTIKEQTNQVLKNIQGILTEAGSDFAHVVKTT